MPRGVTPAVSTAILIAIAIAATAIIAYMINQQTGKLPEKTPSTTFTIEISKAGAMGYGYMHIKHVSGDPVKSGNMRIIVETKSRRVLIEPGRALTWALTSITTSDPVVQRLLSNEGGKLTIKINVTIHGATYSAVAGEVLNVNNTNVIPIYIYCNKSKATSIDNFTLLGGPFYAKNGELNITSSDIDWSQCSGGNITITFGRILTVVNSSKGYYPVGKYGVIEDQDVYVKVDNILNSGVEVKYELEGDGYWYAAPWKFIPGVWPSSDKSTWFGNYTIMPGDVIAGDDVAVYDAETNYIWANLTVSDLLVLTDGSWESTNSGDTVKIVIVYSPSRSILYMSEVVVK